MIADGKDAVVINISVIDRQNREVPDANTLLHFSVTGDAKIIGVGNGDPASHEQDKYFDTAAQRSLFNGHCQVILQAGGNISMIHFEARGEKLYSGATDIYSIQPSTTPHKVTLVNGAPSRTVVNAKRVVDKML